VSSKSYNALSEMMRSCTRCGLCATRHKVVVDRGDPTAKLMFIGESRRSFVSHDQDLGATLLEPSQ
jgi:hypothetical protein